MEDKLLSLTTVVGQTCLKLGNVLFELYCHTWPEEGVSCSSDTPLDVDVR